MFSCCACTKPSKLDTEEVRSDETSDSDEEDSQSIEEDEKSENGDIQNSNDKRYEEEKVEVSAEEIKTEVPNSQNIPIFENTRHSPQKSAASSPQRNSDSTDVLSQKTLFENGKFNQSETEDLEISHTSPLEDKVSSPQKNQTSEDEVESKDLRKLKDEIPSPEKSQSFEDEGPSPENVSNTGSVIYLPSEKEVKDHVPCPEKDESFEDGGSTLENTSNTESVDYPLGEKEVEDHVSSSKLSGSFEDEGPSSESTSNTVSVVHLPDNKKVDDHVSTPKLSGCFEDEGPNSESTSNTVSVVHLPDNKKVEDHVSTSKLSGCFEDEGPNSESTSNTESVVYLPDNKKVEDHISTPKLSGSFEDDDLSPEDTSNTRSDLHMPGPDVDNEIPIPEHVLNVDKNERFENDAPSTKNTSINTSIIRMPGIIIESKEPEILNLETKSLYENNIPIPPTNQSSDKEVFTSPPESESFSLPPEIEGFILPTECGDIIPPPDSGDFNSPLESGDFISPPKFGDIISPPESGDFMPPPESEDSISAPQSGSFIPLPENEDFLPPPESEVFLPPPESEIPSPQKSPTFDSEVPSPQNTWTSSSTDEEKRAIAITKFIGIVSNVKGEKSPLHYAPAYIERTVDDGPEEEGDDSVFESYPPPPPPEIDVDTNKKLPTVPPPIPRWLSQDDEEENISEGYGGMQEPPATPVARDELAMRRHRFFSDLLHATTSSAEHRVRFDPLGPTVHPGCESDDREEHLENLVTRLENVTRRLERVPTPGTPETQEIAVQTKTPSPEKSPSPKKSPRESISSEDQCSRGSSTSISSAASSIVEINNMSVAGYEDLVAGPVREYLELSRKIGGDVASHSQLVEKAFQIQLAFIKTAFTRSAPANQTEQLSLLGPTSLQIQQIQEFRDKHRASPFFNHLSAISESIPALGWVAVSPTPAPYVKEMNDAGQFYTNRVLKDWKEKDKTHVEWCKAWVQTLSELQQYVRNNHTTGLVWAKSGTVPPPPAGGLPPPPPSMPIGDVAPVINDDRSALFAEINQGENITRNLKKVTSDMQTHKNHNLRTGPAPFKAPTTTNSASPMKTTLPANAPIDKPPVFTRDGKKWLVEYQKNNKNLLIENAEMNNVIYMYRCQDSTLVIKGKVNSVVMDSCRKSSVVFNSLVSSIEFVNCQSVQMQVLGKVPTISIDKTDGCQMYLNSESLDVELISSKSSEMNVMVPKGNGDYTEFPVPEQFKTTVSPKGLTTIAVDSLG